jgi:predicted nucleic acid-binding protein
LLHLNLLTDISILFERVHIPKRVREEISKRRAVKGRLRSALRKFSMYKRCDTADPARIEFLLQERKRQRVVRKPNADRGEAEAVIQAEIGASFVIVDDPTGREWATTHGIESHGLIWILAELRRSESFQTFGLSSIPSENRVSSPTG